MDMSTTDIDRTMYSHNVTMSSYLGTFACDTIPEVPSSNTCFISNTDPSEKPGQHWVAFFTNVLGVVFYFDPFGIPPMVINHLEFCKQSSDEVLHYNSKQLQSVRSNTCGAHCINFLLETCRTGDPQTYLKKVKSLPTAMTERLVKQYVRSSSFMYPLTKELMK